MVNGDAVNNDDRDYDRATVESLAGAVRLAFETGADPYLVLGLLVDAAAHGLAWHVPAGDRADAMVAVVELLSDRLRTHGL